MILDFADALANPIQYLSENEKRTQQLEALLMDEDAEDSTDAEPVVQKVRNRSYYLGSFYLYLLKCNQEHYPLLFSLCLFICYKCWKTYVKSRRSPTGKFDFRRK